MDVARSRQAGRQGVALAALAIGVHLLVLHRSDGGEVWINADQVTSLRSPAGRLDRLAPEGHCLIGLTDGKFVGVLESCAEVKQQLEGR